MLEETIIQERLLRLVCNNQGSAAYNGKYDEVISLLSLLYMHDIGNQQLPEDQLKDIKARFEIMTGQQKIAFYNELAKKAAQQKKTSPLEAHNKEELARYFRHRYLPMRSVNMH